MKEYETNYQEYRSVIRIVAKGENLIEVHKLNCKTNPYILF